MTADGLRQALDGHAQAQDELVKARNRVVDLGAYERSLFRNTAPSRVYPIRSS